MSRRRKLTKKGDESREMLTKKLKCSKPTAAVSSEVFEREAKLIVSKLSKELSRRGNAKDSAAMKKYMRDQFEFYGVKTPARREVSKEILTLKDKCFERKDTIDLVSLLWSYPQREFQYVAVDFLVKNRKLICEEQAHFAENVEFFKSLITDKSWWDTVDMLAYKLIGFLVKLYPEQGVAVMRNWVSSDNMWLKRTAILHQLCCKHSTKEELLFEFCRLRCHESEFFIQKAIGWALRDYARTNPGSVKRFLYENKKNLSRLSYNEAAKHLCLDGR